MGSLNILYTCIYNRQKIKITLGKNSSWHELKGYRCMYHKHSSIHSRENCVVPPNCVNDV